MVCAFLHLCVVKKKKKKKKKKKLAAAIIGAGRKKNIRKGTHTLASERGERPYLHYGRDCENAFLLYASGSQREGGDILPSGIFAGEKRRGLREKREIPDFSCASRQRQLPGGRPRTAGKYGPNQTSFLSVADSFCSLSTGHSGVRQTSQAWRLRTSTRKKKGHCKEEKQASASKRKKRAWLFHSCKASF